MKGFVDALISEEKSSLIPDEYDYWRDVIGSWDLDFVYNRGTEKERHIKGEWHFARILEGLGIQDVFICPARGIRAKPSKPSQEYGATIRMFNPGTNKWDMVYTCYKTMSRFVGTKEGDRVVLTNINSRRSRWVFTEIAPDKFHWQNESTMKDGTVKVWCEAFATRM